MTPTELIADVRAVLWPTDDPDEPWTPDTIERVAELIGQRPWTFENTYRVVRFYRDAGIRRRVILPHVSLDEARAHCNDPETSSSTATSRTARARTRAVGAWFDGYEEVRS